MVVGFRVPAASDAHLIRLCTSTLAGGLGAARYILTTASVSIRGSQFKAALKAYQPHEMSISAWPDRYAKSSIINCFEHRTYWSWQ